MTYQRYDGENGVWYTADFSGDGDRTAPVTVVDFVEPTATASTSNAGCEASDFTGFPVGNIALIQRGTCDFGLKVENAKAAGAAGVVLFNEGTIGQADRQDVLIPTLAGYDATGVPVVGTDYATGRALVDLAAAGPVTVRVAVDGFINEDVLTNNVIAETPGGRADRTVVVGGHLDSVYEGPGINDDGSGVATMLETAEQMATLGIKPLNKVRFIFFSGEEQGLLGSDYYVSQLTKKQIQNIPAMLDYDMLASPNYAASSTTVTATSTASPGRRLRPDRAGVQELLGQPGPRLRDHPVRRALGLRRLHRAGIPAGGIFAGAEDIKQPYQVALYGGTAGVAFDKCYHQLCDDLTNINNQGLSEHSDAAIHAILTFAQTTSAVNGTDKGSASATKESDWHGDKLVR